MLNVGKEIAALERMSVAELRVRFAEVYGDPTKCRHKQWLIKRIIWRLQARQEGDLTERARRRAMELANDADIRVTPPRERKLAVDAEARTIVFPISIQPNTELLPGTELRRTYKGRTVRVIVLENGFECDGEHHTSLTAVAKAVTGKHWNGFHFFGLRPRGGAQ